MEKFLRTTDLVVLWDEAAGAKNTHSFNQTHGLK
jgi:hypothetical protein